MNPRYWTLEPTGRICIRDNEEMQSYHELEGKSEYSWTALMTTTSGAYQNEADI